MRVVELDSLFADTCAYFRLGWDGEGEAEAEVEIHQQGTSVELLETDLRKLLNSIETFKQAVKEDRV